MRLELALPAAGVVCAAVYDASGRRLRTLADGPFAAGDHTLDWDGRDAAGAATPSGIYFARIDVAGCVVTRRIARVA